MGNLSSVLPSKQFFPSRTWWTPEQWIEALERAHNSGGRGTIAERRAVALMNTWDQRVDLLEAGLRKMIRSDVSVCC